VVPQDQGHLFILPQKVTDGSHETPHCLSFALTPLLSRSPQGSCNQDEPLHPVDGVTTVRNQIGCNIHTVRLLRLLRFSGTLPDGYPSFRAACRFAANNVVSQLSSNDADVGGWNPAKGSSHHYKGDCVFRSE